MYRNQSQTHIAFHLPMWVVQNLYQIWQLDCALFDFKYMHYQGKRCKIACILITYISIYKPFQKFFSISMTLVKNRTLLLYQTANV